MKICPVCQTYLDHIKVLENQLDKLRREKDHWFDIATGQSPKDRNAKLERPNYLRLASSQ